MKLTRLAILGSTRGTDMLPLIHAIENQELKASIDLVISDKEEAPILQKAKSHGLPSLFIDPQGKSRQTFDEIATGALEIKNIDLIVLIGFMRILSPGFVTRWENKIINVHPSLLPAYAGGMDQNVHEAVLAAGEVETGCTVHLVTEEVDLGPVLIQKRCNVLRHDTALSLKERVQALEGQALIEAISLMQKDLR